MLRLLMSVFKQIFAFDLTKLTSTLDSLKKLDITV